MLLALGLCQSVPYLLSRVWVYEVAIGAGYFCISGALFSSRAAFNPTRGPYWLAASGLMFGLAVSCRPHLVLAGAIAAVGLVVFLAKSRGFRSALVSREWLAFAAAFALAGAAIAALQLSALRQSVRVWPAIHPRRTQPESTQAGLREHPAGAVFLARVPAGLDARVPWVRLAFRYPFNSTAWPFPPGYFMEATVGALFLAPFAVAAAFVPAHAALRTAQCGSFSGRP